MYFMVTSSSSLFPLDFVAFFMYQYASAKRKNFFLGDILNFTLLYSNEQIENVHKNRCMETQLNVLHYPYVIYWHCDMTRHVSMEQIIYWDHKIDSSVCSHRWTSKLTNGFKVLQSYSTIWHSMSSGIKLLSAFQRITLLLINVFKLNELEIWHGATGHILD